MIWQGFENTLFTLEVFPPVREGSHPGDRREGQENQGPHVGSTDEGGWRGGGGRGRGRGGGTLVS